MRAAGTVLLILFAGLAAPTASPDTALTQGNRLFERDDVEGALAAYERGWRGDGSRADGVLAGVLAYNAGTCALRLGRLPEALLWYRRAETAIPGDPWLRDNLAHTRQALGDPPVEAVSFRGVRERWLPGRFPFAALGVALSWVALVLILLVRHPPRGLLAFAALLACGCFAAGMLFPERNGPNAAVLLAPCPAKGGLPAGSEVRVRPLDGGGWRIVGHGDSPSCPPEAVGLIGP
jgi:hypothetical protein